MYELIMIVCLLGEPDVCKQRRLPFREPVSIMDCMLRGQISTAKWLKENPRWSLKRWRCSPVEA